MQLTFQRNPKKGEIQMFRKLIPEVLSEKVVSKLVLESNCPIHPISRSSVHNFSLRQLALPDISILS